MYLLDYDMSVAVGVGFIALGGVAAETGVIMSIYPDHAYEAMRRRTHHRERTVRGSRDRGCSGCDPK